MAKTYTASYLSVAFAATKNMAAIFNAHATRKVKIMRIWAVNSQLTTAITGTTNVMSLRKITAIATTPTVVTPIPHDSADVTVDLTSITAYTAGTQTWGTQPADTWLGFPFNIDEVLISSALAAPLGTFFPLNKIVDFTQDTNVQPITLNTNQGLGIYNSAGAVGTADIFIEFTVV